MNPPPIALGIVLCEKVIVEEGTRSATLVSVFKRLEVERFPSPPQQFALAAWLTDGQGDGRLELVIKRLETDEEIYAARRPLHLPNQLAEVRVTLHIRDCVFPAPGQYEAVLQADGVWIARRKFSVRLREQQP
jgi:hypothetical protein